MTDEYRRKPADALDEQKGKATEATGEPYDGRVTRHGAVSQDAEEAQDDRPTPTTKARKEQDRQVETGEDPPG